MVNVFAKILGLGDLFAMVIILFAPVFPKQIILYGAAFLILKGGLFAYTGNLTSLLDVGCGLYAVALAFGASSTILTVVTVIFLAQKAVFSWL